MIAEKLLSTPALTGRACFLRLADNFSMSMTSITSATVISSSSAAFTLLLSVLWLRERVTILKLLGVGLCMLGNVLTVFVDDGTHSNSTAAAAGLACYP